ncbi:MAG: UDP-N-acetylglucosamine 2-epimerase (non-hydrolyzing) [bacterium]
MKKIMVIFGTRPEAIKLAPVIHALKNEKYFEVVVCSTGQHKEMLQQVLDIFNIDIDYDFNLMKPNQDLFDITINSLSKLRDVFSTFKPDLLIVQGDTSTAFVSSLAAYYLRIKIAHVEAGLRSYDIYSPYPEEANRRFISVISNFNFAPTEEAKNNLINEGLSKDNIFVTGNTVIDALLQVKLMLENNRLGKKVQNELEQSIGKDILDKPYILITLHRREKFGTEFNKVLSTIKEIAKSRPEYNFIYPVHLNPNVKNPVNEILSGIENIKLITPQDYLRFIYLMSKCFFILTDSGGIQEECYIFKKPIMVLRNVTERMEAVNAGYAFLVESDENLIKSKFYEIEEKLLNNFDYFCCPNPFGSGNSAKLITNIILKLI